jgi:hypothetical protein
MTSLKGRRWQARPSSEIAFCNTLQKSFSCSAIHIIRTPRPSFGRCWALNRFCRFTRHPFATNWTKRSIKSFSTCWKHYAVTGGRCRLSSKPLRYERARARKLASPRPLINVLLSVFNFYVLTLRTVDRSPRSLGKPDSLIERCSIG